MGWGDPILPDRPLEPKGMAPGSGPVPTAPPPPRSDPERHARVAARPDASAVFAFAAIEAINAGDWDRYLLRIRGAIELRRRTDEYAAHVVAGD